MTRMLAIAAAAAFSLAGGAQAAVFSDNFDGYTAGAPASLSPNWTVTEGSVDVIPVGPLYTWYGTGQYVDLNGSNGDATAGRIETTVNLLAGKTYNLSFNYGYNVNSGFNESMNFGITGAYAGLLSSLDFGSVAPPVMNSFGTTFTVGVSGAYTLFFADGQAGSPFNDDDDQGGPILDNVSLTSVPLPAGAPLLLAGLVALGALRRRRAA